MKICLWKEIYLNTTIAMFIWFLSHTEEAFLYFGKTEWVLTTEIKSL